MSDSTLRRDLVKSAAAIYTTNLFTGRLWGANDTLQTAFIGMGRMGLGNMNAAMKQDKLRVAAVCDVYQPALDGAVDKTKAQAGGAARAVKDFREIMADKSIDAVCIATPDHWHAYMAVEACKAGKDVYVEKPISVTIDEGKKMVQAARKYKRVVQAGTMQRSGGYFLQAAEIVKSGKLGEITFCHAYQAGTTP